jgi:hypothetical protein
MNVFTLTLSQKMLSKYVLSGRLLYRYKKHLIQNVITEARGEEATMATRQVYGDQVPVLAWENRTQEHLYSVAPARTRGRMIPTPRQRQRALTGFLLSIFSLFAAFFPICGLPIAIVALVMGAASCRIFALRTLATWGLAFSIVGLLLTFVNICIDIGTYFSNYMLK